jgi:hypothetical protein
MGVIYCLDKITVSFNRKGVERVTSLPVVAKPLFAAYTV